MKKMCLALLGTVVFASVAVASEEGMPAPQPSSSCGFSGFYAGLGLGYDFGDVSVAGASISPGGFGGGVFAGWGTEFSKVYLGAELGYYLNTSKQTRILINAGVPIEAEAKIKGRLEVAARIGYNAGGMLPYAKLGYGWIQQTLTDKTANTTIFDKRMSGLLLGAGLDYKINQKLLTGIGYTYADLKKNFTDSNGVAGKAALTNHSVLLRVGYHF